MVGKEGEERPFWSLPKRPPKAQVFDQSNSAHRNFIAAYACLFATMYGVKIPYEAPRSDEAKTAMAELASTVPVKDFLPDDAKARAIESTVDKESKEQTKVFDEEDLPDNDEEEIKVIDTALTKKKSLSPAQLENQFQDTVLQDRMPELQGEEFEKDNDQNFHVDFIDAAANVRALNYGLPSMDWITVKLKAGRIVPALATTTAAISGLQTIELLKLIKRGSNLAEASEKYPVEKFRNTFLNLAVPCLMLSEPGAPIKSTIKEGLVVDTWQRWEIGISATTKLGSILQSLAKQFSLQPRDVIYESTPIFFYALRQRDLSMNKQPQMRQPILDLVKAVVTQEVFD